MQTARLADKHILQDCQDFTKIQYITKIQAIEKKKSDFNATENKEYAKQDVKISTDLE